METLELKHLAPYLPYGLKLWVGIDGFEYKTIFTGFEHFMGRPHIETKGDLGYQLHTFNSDIEGEFIKPILRHLSQLTKEIEHNGERFVPNHHKYFKYFIKFDLQTFIEECPSHIEWHQLELLFKWHFDVFGLIDKGLALPLKTD